MAFLDKLGDLAKNLGDKTQDAIETTKLNSKINGEKNAAAECMRKIGEYYYGRYKEDGQADPELAELYAAIDGHNQTIADAQGEIDRIKSESAAQSAAAQPAAAPGGASCTACGKVNPAGTKFCSDCGAKIEAPAAPVCPGCGAQLAPGVKFCAECGYKLA
ncbi:MAG: zinc ribbon domain-containing protein [Oscillospiraceae bacterium]|jgi:hypothetical protein|nr:zinc ribbon domain-containing protein [Oscillospiraceae bacterium]